MGGRSPGVFGTFAAVVEAMLGEDVAGEAGPPATDPAAGSEEGEKKEAMTAPASALQAPNQISRKVHKIRVLLALHRAPNRTGFESGLPIRDSTACKGGSSSAFVLKGQGERDRRQGKDAG